MKKISYLILFLILFVYCTYFKCFAQTQFRGYFLGSWWESAHSIIKTTDGGYAIAGLFNLINSQTAYDMHVCKLNSNFTVQWNVSIGGTAYEDAHSIIQTFDGGYIIAGNTNSFGLMYFQMYILKLSPMGILQWNKVIGGSGETFGSSLIQCQDGSYVITGSTRAFGAGLYDIFIVKLNSNGNLVWSKTVGGPSNDYASKIIRTTNNGFMIAGTTSSFGIGSLNMYFLKFDSNGMLHWNRTVGGVHSDIASSIVQTSDSGFAAVGSSSSFEAGRYDIYIVKLSNNGNLLWGKTVRVAYDDIANDIIQTTDGGYAVVGDVDTSYAGRSFIYIAKFDVNGNLLWNKIQNDADSGYSIVQTSDCGYAIVGAKRDFNFTGYIVKFDSNGNTCGNNTTSPVCTMGTGGSTTSPTPTFNSPTPIITTPSPSTYSGPNLITICSVAGIQPESGDTPFSIKLFQNYPNPFNPVTKIKFSIPARETGQIFLSVYDVLGREVATLVNEKLSPGTYEVEWDGSNYPSGVYFYKLETETYSQTKKLILIK